MPFTARSKKEQAWMVTAIAGGLVVAVAAVAWLLLPVDESAIDGETVTAEAGGVTVKAVRAAGDPSRFDVTLDTHTVDLEAYDLTANVFLEQDGRRIPVDPSSGPAEGTSHHRTATLVFADATEGPAVLVLLDLADVPERRLEFR